MFNIKNKKLAFDAETYDMSGVNGGTNFKFEPLFFNAHMDSSEESTLVLSTISSCSKRRFNRHLKRW